MPLQLQDADIARRYARIRKVSIGLNSDLIRLLSKQSIERAARELGMLRNGVIHFRDADQSGVLMDFAIHDCREDGRNAVARYQTTRTPTREQGEILDAMGRGHYSIFQVESVVRGIGVHVNDLLRQERRFLADRGFGSSAAIGVAVATRVYDFSDFLITGGAGLPIDAGVLTQVARLLRVPENRDVCDMPPEQRARFNASIIRLGLGDGNSAKFRYEDVDGNSESEPAPAFPPRAPGPQRAVPLREREKV